MDEEKDDLKMNVIECREAAELSLEIVDQTRKNGLYVEAVMMTIEALEHIENGLTQASDNEEEIDTLKNLQLKANSLLDCLLQIVKSHEKVEKLREVLELSEQEDSGLATVFKCDGVEYRRVDRCHNVVNFVSSGSLELFKIVKPRLIYYIKISSSGSDVWTTSLGDDINTILDKAKQELNFPDIEGEGNILIKIVDSEGLEELIRIFEECGIAIQIVDLPEGTAIRYSQGLVRGASYVSLGLIKGAEKTGEFLTYGTPYVISKLAKQEDNAPVSQNWRNATSIARNVTSKAAGITGFVAEKIGSATMTVGHMLAPHIQTQGARLLSYGTGISESEASDKMNNVLTMTAGAVEAVSTIYSGVEESVKIVGSSISSNSEKIIEHKYGASARDLAADTFQTVGNVYTISKNTKALQPKNLVKSTAKNTGKSIIGEFKPQDTPGPSK